MHKYRCIQTTNLAKFWPNYKVFKKLSLTFPVQQYPITEGECLEDDQSHQCDKSASY